MSSFVASDMETTLPSRGHLNLPPTPQRKSVALPTFPSVYNVFQTASGSSDQMSSEVSPIRYAKLCPVCGFKPPAELDIRRHIEQCFEQNKLVSIHYAPTELDQLKLICRASTDKTVMMKRDTGSLYKSMARLTLNNRLSIKEAFERLARQASVSEQERYGAKYNMASVSSEGPEEFHSFEYQAMLLCFKQGERCRQTPEEQNASAVAAAAAAAIASVSVQPQTQALPAAPLAAQSVSVHVSSPLVTPATPLAKALPVPAMPVSTASSASTDLAYSAAVAQSPSHQQVLKAMQESGNAMSTMGLPLPLPVMGTTVSASTSSPAAVATPALAFFSTSETQQQQDGSTMSVSRPANESDTYFLRNTRRKLEPLVTSSTNGATAALTPSHSARPLPATPLSVTSAAVPAVTMASLPPSSTRASVVKSSPRASSVFTFQPLEPTPTVTAQYSPQTNSVTSSAQENADLEAWRSDLKRRFVEMCDTRGPANNPPLKAHHAEEYNSPYLNLPSTGPSVSREFALALALQTGNAVPALTVKRPMEYTGSSGASESGYSVYSTSSVHCTAPTTTTATAGTDNSNATAWRGDAELNQNNNWINNSNSLHNNNTSRVARDLFNQQFSTHSQSQTGSRQQLTVTEADLAAKDWYAYPSPAFQLPPAYLQRSTAPTTVQSPLPSAPPAREPSYYPSMWLAERPSSSPMNDVDMDSSAPSLSNSASFNSASGFTANSSLNAFRMWPPQPQMGLAQSAGGGLFGLHSRSSFDPPLDFTSSF